MGDYRYRSPQLISSDGVVAEVYSLILHARRNARSESTRIKASRIAATKTNTSGFSARYQIFEFDSGSRITNGEKEMDRTAPHAHPSVSMLCSDAEMGFLAISCTRSGVGWLDQGRPSLQVEWTGRKLNLPISPMSDTHSMAIWSNRIAFPSLSQMWRGWQTRETLKSATCLRRPRPHFRQGSVWRAPFVSIAHNGPSRVNSDSAIKVESRQWPSGCSPNMYAHNASP